ncbi:ubiquitin-conjugating enzyme E2 W [Cryptococcus wingfieldii CBS 7118]|uniref:Ubiquitin-conjugating enzyme E2 W n=1 Tax=Cryptococcus wingfieldii CBS 7118 TaxID=1295528 RepID=A0A1E3IVV1_9TREE|nr:ubiquitin-conjugating enzyme E2 W [Cryptococcus wingfieldii CBS 7118]ODN92743.1 ubiquitin-conjugating enzyme E2 W [Cryptococcus wingfieldii CBS 7118]
MSVRLATKRLMKELGDINTKGTPPGIALLSADSMEEWIFTIAVLGDETVYRGEVFALRIKFEDRYPIEVPQVTFIADNEWTPPVHPHIYTNGHICASILGHEWSPVLNAISICITMQSMLASCKKKELPEGNDRYVRSAPSNPKKTRWHYDDDVSLFSYAFSSD